MILHKNRNLNQLQIDRIQGNIIFYLVDKIFEIFKINIEIRIRQVKRYC